MRVKGVVLRTLLCATGFIMSSGRITPVDTFKIQSSAHLTEQAGLQHFDYEKHLQNALNGHESSLIQLIEYSLEVDGEIALAHGAMLLKLRSKLGRDTFKSAFVKASPPARKCSHAFVEIAEKTQRKMKN